MNSGKKTDAMKTFEDEIKKRLIKRKTKLRVRGFMQFCIDTRDELFMNEDSLKEIQFSFLKNKQDEKKTFTQPKITSFFN